MTDEERKRYWALFFTTIVGWQEHPGNKPKTFRDSDERISRFADAALTSDVMLKHMEDRWPTGAQ